MKTRKSILIVDDSANIRKLVRVIIKRAGDYEYLEAVDGREGLEKALKYKPDLIILDLIIPKIYGIELIRKIKAHKETKDIPIIILTSETTYEAVEQAKEAGADIFMGKPFEPKDLRESVRELLGN